MDKMGRSEIASLEIIDRICNYFNCNFNCNIEDVIEHLQMEGGHDGK